MATGIAAAFILILRDASATDTLRVLSRGLAITVRATLIGFAGAMVLGTLAGLARSSGPRPARELATLYIEVVRGVPLLVLILWVGYALTPWAVSQGRDLITGWAEAGWSVGGLVPWLAAAVEPCRQPSRCVSQEARGILGLSVGYGAYLAEIVRAGIQSVGQGQRDAAKALGLNPWQSLRLVVLPQALRLSLPPLGNDFIAMLKDSSLISVLAVPELVQMARFEISRTFQAFAVWNLVALMYLVMTLTLSLGVRYLERRTSFEGP